MLIIKRLINQIKRQHVIFINIYKSDEDNIVFAIKVYFKLIKNDDNI